MIRKRRKDVDTDAVVETDDVVESQEAAVEVDESTTEELPGLSPRPQGPWDAMEVDGEDDRIDFGGLRLKGVDGLQVQAQVDDKTGAVSVITLVIGDGSLQVQAFAAPRATGIWSDARRQIMSSITGQGGLVEEAPGPYGTELRARVPGQGGLQPIRFVGVDGPRWFLRGLFIGSAAAPDGHAALEQVFRDLVVVRGDDAMVPGEAIALSLPQAAPAVTDESA
jgi:hypothetical protein